MIDASRPHECDVDEIRVVGPGINERPLERYDPVGLLQQLAQHRSASCGLIEKILAQFARKHARPGSFRSPADQT